MTAEGEHRPDLFDVMLRGGKPRTPTPEEVARKEWAASGRQWAPGGVALLALAVACGAPDPFAAVDDLAADYPLLKSMPQIPDRVLRVAVERWQK